MSEPVQVHVHNNINASTDSSKSKWVAFVLAFVLGYLGVHRFYVGKVGTGILYLFTGGLFGVGALVDWITILIGNFKDKEGKVLR